MVPRPPDEIDGGVVRLRRVRHRDAADLEAAMVASRGHLAPWMPWAADECLGQRARTWCEESERHWEEGTDFAYVVTDPVGEVVLGCAGLHDRVAPGGLEIGYWIHVDHVGHGYATAAAGALTKVALAMPGMARVEIHCDVANRRSAAVATRLGYRLARLDDSEARAPQDTGRSMIWLYEPAPVSPGS